jgi:APA family basic amino acid/polyamine antiporter
MSLRRELGLPGAIIMGLGSIIGTGVFVSIAIAADVAGADVILAIAIAAAVATCNALSSAQLAANHPPLRRHALGRLPDFPEMPNLRCDKEL